MANQQDLERWCYDRALSLVTRELRTQLGPDSRYAAFAAVAVARTELGVAGYGNGGGVRKKPSLQEERDIDIDDGC